MARDERGGGSVSVWMLLMVPVILVMAGLVFDCLLYTSPSPRDS